MVSSMRRPATASSIRLRPARCSTVKLRRFPLIREVEWMMRIIGSSRRATVNA